MTTGSILELYSYLATYGYNMAKEARFSVMIMPPIGLPGISTAVSQGLVFQCESAQLPARTMSLFETRTYGPIQKFPYQTTYSDLQLTFFCTGSMWEKTFFDSWIDFVNPVDSVSGTGTAPYNFNYKQTYSTTILITQYDEMSNPTYVIQLLEAFPFEISQLNLDWGSEQIHKLTVHVAYTRWTSVPFGSSGLLPILADFTTAASSLALSIGSSLISSL